jgi:hypothetical protein
MTAWRRLLLQRTAESRIGGRGACILTDSTFPVFRSTLCGRAASSSSPPDLSPETKVLGQSAIHLDVGTGSESEFYWKGFMTTSIHLPVRISLVMTPLDVGTEVQATMTDRLGFVTVQVPHLGNIAVPKVRLGLGQGYAKAFDVLGRTLQSAC